MNSIIYPMKVHAVKLEYRRLELERMPHGYFTVWRGMNDKVDYSLRAATKITGFSRDMYRPGKEVIYIHVYDRQNFDRDYFVSQVL